MGKTFETLDKELRRIAEERKQILDTRIHAFCDSFFVETMQKKVGNMNVKEVKKFGSELAEQVLSSSEQEQNNVPTEEFLQDEKFVVFVKSLYKNTNICEIIEDCSTSVLIEMGNQFGCSAGNVRHMIESKLENNLQQ